MTTLEFGQMVTFDQGYGEKGIVLRDDGEKLTIIAEGEESYTYPVCCRDGGGIAVLNGNWESIEWAIAVIDRDLEKLDVDERWDRPQDHPKYGSCEFNATDFITTMLIGSWNVYPPRITDHDRKHRPKGCDGRKLLEGARKVLESMEIHTA